EQLLARQLRRDPYRRREKLGSHAAAGRRTDRMARVADAHPDVGGAHAQHLRHDLRRGGADAASDVGDTGAALDAAVAVDEDLRRRGRPVEVVPDPLREPDAALDRSGRSAGLSLPRFRPADPLGADAPLLAPREVRIVLVAKLERVDAELLRE